MSLWVPSLLWTGGRQVFVNAASVESVAVLGPAVRPAGGRAPDADADPEDAMARSPRRVGSGEVLGAGALI